MRVLTLFLLWPLLGQASVLTVQGAQATVTTDQGSFTLTHSGTGTLKRSFGFIVFNVATVSAYMDDVKALRTAPSYFEGVKIQKRKALTLTMLRHLTNGQVRIAFEEAMERNDIPESSLSRDVLYQWQGDMKLGAKATLVSYHLADGTEHVIFETPNKTFHLDGPEISDDFWKIWFAKIGKENLPMQEHLVGKD